MSKKSFKPTHIPYRAENGVPMAYYVLAEDEKTHIEVTRAVCLAPTEVSDNPYPQRWFVDEESGLVVRLTRTKKSDELARDNMRYIWREAKDQERLIACIGKGNAKCPKTCANCRMADTCDSKHKESDGVGCVKKCESCDQAQSRTVELDMYFVSEDGGEDDGYEAHYEPADPDDVQAIVEGKALLETLHAALAALAKEDRKLIVDSYWNGKTERELAPLLGLKEPKSVNKRKHKIYSILRENPALKSFFE